MNPPSDPSPAKAPTGAAREALCDCGRIEHGRHHSACPAFAEPYKRASPAEAADVTPEIVVTVDIAQGIPADHWLRTSPEWAWFVCGYEHAERATRAIPALSRVSPADLRHAVEAILWGAAADGHAVPWALPSPAPEGGRDAATAKPTNPYQFSSPRDEPRYVLTATLGKASVHDRHAEAIVWRGPYSGTDDMRAAHEACDRLNGSGRADDEGNDADGIPSLAEALEASAVPAVPTAEPADHAGTPIRLADGYAAIGKAADRERELSMYRTLWQDAITNVDRVFQVGGQPEPPLLPDFLPIGASKFQGVVMLAEAYIAQGADRDALARRVGEKLDKVMAVIQQGRGTWPSPDYITDDALNQYYGEAHAYRQVMALLAAPATGGKGAGDAK